MKNIQLRRVKNKNYYLKKIKCSMNKKKEKKNKKTVIAIDKNL